LKLAVALGLTALFVLALFAACGGDGDKTVDIPGGGEVSLSEDLPDEFPDDFPVYDGADLQGSYRGESEGVEGIVATWTTGDSVEDVASFYEEKLNGDNWTVQSKGSQGGLGSYFFATNSDESKVAYVYIAGSEGEDTTILVTVGDDDGSFTGGEDAGSDTPDAGDDASGDSGDDSGDDGSSGDDSTSDAQLPDEQDLSDDYPADQVPLPDDIRVTSSSSLATGGVESFYVEFYSKKSADEIADFFKNELPGNGWTETLTSETDGDIYLSFGSADTAETGSSVTIIISEADVEGYRLVNVAVVGA
jgi:hypothetical protein